MVIAVCIRPLLELGMAATIVSLLILCRLSRILSLLVFVSEIRLSPEGFRLERPSDALGKRLAKTCMRYARGFESFGNARIPPFAN